MKLIFRTRSEKEAKLRLASIKSLGRKGLIKYEEDYKIYKVFQTNHLTLPKCSCCGQGIRQ